MILFIFLICCTGSLPIQMTLLLYFSFIYFIVNLVCLKIPSFVGIEVMYLLQGEREEEMGHYYVFRILSINHIESVKIIKIKIKF